MKNFQSLKPKVEALINPVLEKHHLKIYEINNFNEFGQDILQILVEDQSDAFKALDLDLMMKVNEEVSLTLDQLDNQIEKNYLLEVASAGIERQIKSETELANNLQGFVFVQLNQPTKEKLTEFNATVESYDPSTKLFTLTYFVKGQKKKGQFLYSDFKTIRYAVKF